LAGIAVANSNGEIGSISGIGTTIGTNSTQIAFAILHNYYFKYVIELKVKKGEKT